MKKFVFFVFKGEALCFMHVLLNTLDMESKGIAAKIVIEGEAVVLVKKMMESENPLFKKVMDKGLIDCICKACSAKMDVLEYNSTCGIPLNSGMSGHPPMAAFIEDGFEVITL